MKTWLALIVAPGIALAVQSIMYALVTPSCSDQTRIWIHVAAALALAATVVLALLAHTEWRRGASLAPTDSIRGDPHTNRRFLAGVALGVATISSLVIICMWLGAWLLSPCYAV